MADVMPGTSSTPEGQRPTVTPAEFPARREYDLSTNAALQEIRLDQGRLLERSDAVIRDLGGLSTKVGELKDAYQFIRGAAWAVAVVVPFAAGALWWSLSDRIDQLHRLLDNRAAQSQQVTPPPQNKRGP